jgi:hypothetical protein
MNFVKCIKPRPIGSLLVTLIFCVISVGCDFGLSPTPNILVIAIDSFPLGSWTCNQTREGAGQSGKSILCQEGVRFTHAFTTSTLARPALASLLTSDYPHSLGISNNYSDYISSHVDLFSEIAFRNGYRTSFFSGGAPIFRSSNFSQGFELFQDSFNLREDRLFHKVEESVDLFQSWHKGVAGPFLSVFYLNDMLHLKAKSFDGDGLERPSTRQGKLDEISQELGRLFKYLKSAGAWDDTFVFVVGLNGVSAPYRSNLVKHENLFFENTSVSLYIKPQTKKRDLGLQWKVDENVSLVDVGATIFEILGVSRESRRGNNSKSLLSYLKNKDVISKDERFIMVESGWGDWLSKYVKRVGARIGNYLYLHDTDVNVFNTLIDRGEVAALSDLPPVIKDRVSKIRQDYSDRGLDFWGGANRMVKDKSLFFTDIQTSSVSVATIAREYRALSKILDSSKEIENWIIHFWIEQKKYSELSSFLKKEGKKSAKSYLLDRILERKTISPTEASACFLAIVKGLKLERLDSCEEEGLRALYRYETEADEEKKRKWFYSLSRVYFERRIETAVKMINLQNESYFFPNGQTDLEMSEFDIILNLPKYKSLRSQLDAIREKDDEQLDLQFF